MSDVAAEVRDLRMRYGTKDVLNGIDFEIRTGEVVALLGPNGAGKTTTIEILEGFRARSAGQVSVLGTDPERGGEQWRARLGVVLQSWRDHAKWRVRELLHHLGAYYARYATDRDPPAVGHRRADRPGRAHRPGEQPDREPVRRPATQARRRHRHRRAARAAVPRRADGRLRPDGAPGVPRARAPAHRPGAGDRAAHHARPRRGGEARRPGADPGGRADRRRRLTGRARAADVGAGRGPVDRRRAALRAPDRARRRRSPGSCSPSTARRSRTWRCGGRTWRTPTWHWSRSTSSEPPAHGRGSASPAAASRCGTSSPTGRTWSRTCSSP